MTQLIRLIRDSHADVLSQHFKTILLLLLETLADANVRHLFSSLSLLYIILFCMTVKKGKGSPYSIVERVVPELIPVLGSQPAGDVSHKPGGRLPLLSTRPAVTLATLKRAATSVAA